MATRSASQEKALGKLIPEDVLHATESRMPDFVQAAQSGSGFEAMDMSSEPSARELLQQNEPRHIRARMQRMGLSRETARKAASAILATSRGGFEAMGFGGAVDVPEDMPTEAVVGLERILGNNELMSVRFLDLGHLVGRTVGRVVVRKTSGRIAGYGTGFLVSPKLLLTNNHVLNSENQAANSEIEFDYQESVRGDLLDPVAFKLNPDAFFLTDRALDFTLVAVAPSAGTSTKLQQFGWVRLDEKEGEVLIGEKVNIIQHPNGERKQLAVRENQIVGIAEERFLQYRTDTAPGSSGSPVFNDEWDVVGLHHSGVPRKDAEGRILTRDGSIWKRNMGEHRIDWIANEGIRVASILQFVRDSSLSGTQAALRRELLEGDEPMLITERKTQFRRPRVEGDQSAPAPSGGVSTVLRLSDSMNASEWTIPIEITVRVQTPTLSGNDSAEDVIGDEAVSIDPDYGSREGYDPEFLGKKRRRIPLPRLSDDMKEIAAVNQEAQEGEDRYVLPYHHYSVVMNGERRLAFFTAVNIDGSRNMRIRRERDKWLFDPRIERNQQAGNAIYRNNPLDRGHLVRRLDPAWGDDEPIAKVANDDTFHYTNCSPQHKDFNQNKTTWQGLENYILDNAIAEDFRISVFTGPVFDESDDRYRGIQLPRQFWKVVVMIRENGSPSATAYLLSQKPLLRNLGVEGLEAFEYGQYETFQVAVTRIEDLTGLDFGKLRGFDPNNGQESFGFEGLSAIELNSPDQIVF